MVADEALSAATISELAALMQVPIENFKKEIERYNRAALGQKPADSKSSRAISKCSRIGCTELTEPPFWAYEVGLTVHYTPGGISINENAQVLAADGKVIEGLWAAGEVTGSVHGANRLGGNGLTDAFTFGRLAGATVAQRD